MLGIEILKRMGGGSAGGSEVTLLSGFVSGNGDARWHINPNRTVTDTNDSAVIGSPVVTALYNWLGAAYTPADYEARATLLSGNAPPGGIGTWQNLVSAVGWGWTGSTIYKACEIKVEVRLAATGAILAECIVNIEANGTL